jgi:hypothetical protein
MSTRRFVSALLSVLATACLLAGLCATCRGQALPNIHSLGIKTPKIQDISWSIQAQRCVVQITLPAVREGKKMPDQPDTQVLLLKSDGTTIPATYQPPSGGISMVGSVTYFSVYSFPITNDADAWAIVMSIDGKLFVRRLVPDAEAAVSPQTKP